MNHCPRCTIHGLCELQVPAASIASTVIHIQKFSRPDCLGGLILTCCHWHYELHGEQNLKFLKFLRYLRLFSANSTNRPWPPTTFGARSSTVNKIWRQFFATRAWPPTAIGAGARSSTRNKTLRLFFGNRLWPPTAIGARSSTRNEILRLFSANRLWPPTAIGARSSTRNKIWNF